MNQSNLYMYHLDNLRRSRKITVESFCEGICSDRQYRRLLSGQQNISDQKIYDFCNKLGISAKDFYYSANEKDRYEYSKVVALYSHLQKNDLSMFLKELKEIKEERLVNNQNKRFLNYCLIKYQNMTNKVNDKTCIEELSSICSYPQNKKYESFDFVDIISLAMIAEIEVKYKREEALILLSKILTSGRLIYISSESRHILPNVYTTVSILLSRLQKFEEAFNLSKSGVEYSIAHSNFSTLTHLYYVQFYTSLKLGNNRQAEIYAVKSLANCIAKGDKIEYNTTYNLLKKNLGSDPVTLFSIYGNEVFK